MSTSEMVQLARRIATAAHAGQCRRDGVTPYISHPQAVAERVAGDTVAEAVAWLHDVLEDTPVSAEELVAGGLPADVVDRVQLLTKRDGVPYEEYLGRIRADPIATRVKVADMLANLSDRPSERQIVKYAKGLLRLLG